MTTTAVTKLSLDDESKFVVYLATQDPRNESRRKLGKLYNDLEANREKKWPFGPKYRAREWYEFYVNNQAEYDHRAEQCRKKIGAAVQEKKLERSSESPPPSGDPRPTYTLPATPLRRKGTATPSSSQRRPFTEVEEWQLAQYLAVENPSPKNRTGYQIYEKLRADERGLWGWGRNHTVKSWWERYRRNRPKFDKWIENYQKRFNIDPDRNPQHELWGSLPPLHPSHFDTPPEPSSSRAAPYDGTRKPTSRPSGRASSVRSNVRPPGQVKTREAVVVESDSEDADNAEDELVLPRLSLSAKALGKRPLVNHKRTGNQERDEVATSDLVQEQRHSSSRNMDEQARSAMPPPSTRDSSPLLSPPMAPAKLPSPRSKLSETSFKALPSFKRLQEPTPPTSESTTSPSPKKASSASRNVKHSSDAASGLVEAPQDRPSPTKRSILKRRRTSGDEFFDDLEDSAHSSPWPIKKRKPLVRLEGGFGNSILTDPTRAEQAFRNGRRLSGVEGMPPPPPSPTPPPAQAAWPPKRSKARRSAAAQQQQPKDIPPIVIHDAEEEDEHHPFSQPTQPTRIRDYVSEGAEDHHPFSQPTQAVPVAGSSKEVDLEIHHPFSQPDPILMEGSSSLFQESESMADHHPFSQPSQAFLGEQVSEADERDDSPAHLAVKETHHTTEDEDLTDEEAVENAILPPELTQENKTAPRKSDFGVQASPSKRLNTSSASALRIQRIKGKQRADAPDRAARRHTLALPSGTSLASGISPSAILGRRPRYSMPVAGTSRLSGMGYTSHTAPNTSLSYAGVQITPEDQNELVREGLESRLRDLSLETGFPFDVVHHAWRTTGQLGLTRAFLLALCDHVVTAAGDLTRTFVEAAQAEGFYDGEDGPGSASMSVERRYWPPEDSKAADWLRANMSKVNDGDGAQDDDEDDESRSGQESRILSGLRRLS